MEAAYVTLNLKVPYLWRVSQRFPQAILDEADNLKSEGEPQRPGIESGLSI
jgi:hypothetical protein